MTKNDDIPESRLARCIEGGKTVARLGGMQLKYAARKAFLTDEAKDEARKEMAEQSSEALFEGLCKLKGTALKLAQLISLELDLFPSEVRIQLERSYHNVPPMNRVLARKVIINAFGKPPEKVFHSFDAQAFAAASLGQVHKATATGGQALAVKLQYPGIRNTIDSDVKIVRSLFKPFSEYELILPVLKEVEARFIEETEYRQESENAAFFKNNLKVDKLRIPSVFPELCSDNVLCLSFMEGLPLNEWLKTNPSQKQRDAVAQVMQEAFLKCLYELNCIHADPHPGNWLIHGDGSVGLVDFGCIKRFDERFISLYQQLSHQAVKSDQDAYFDLLEELEVLPRGSKGPYEAEILELSRQFGDWLAKLFSVDVFDFSRQKDFIREGKAIMTGMIKYRDYLCVNPHFTFLNRTRYGLLRLYELMGARVSFRNPYEFDACP